MEKSQMVGFDADLYMLSKDEGGRHTPVKSGAFRTDVRFKDGARFCSISFDGDFLYPGESKKICIDVLLHSKKEVDYLLSLDCWLLFDGETNVGRVSSPVLRKD